MNKDAATYSSSTSTPKTTRTPNQTQQQPSPTRFPRAPSEFNLVDSDYGVQLFRKDYTNGTPDFVQVVDLSQDASLKFMYGEIVEPRPGKGGFGHGDPRMTSLTIDNYWKQATESDSHAMCVTNGLFFYMPEYPTRLAFPLKVENEFISDGFGLHTYPGEKIILEIWENRANIRELTRNNFNQSTAPDIIGGLTEQANKRAKSPVGRTFLGIADYNEDGIFEMVLLFNTKTSLQTSAANVLRSFGAENVIMLDGGGSTQLLCRGTRLIESDRPIPQAIAAIAGEPPKVKTEIILTPEWPILREGENFNLEFKIKNTGIVTWTPSTTKLFLEKSSVNEQFQQFISQSIQPSQEASFSQTLASFPKPSIFPIQLNWGLINNGKLYKGETITFKIVVLPSDLENKKGALNQLIDQWQIQRPEEIEELILKWMEAYEGDRTPITESNLKREGIKLENAMTIPLLMLPIVIILILIIVKKRT